MKDETSFLGLLSQATIKNLDELRVYMRSAGMQEAAIEGELNSLGYLVFLTLVKDIVVNNKEKLAGQSLDSVEGVKAFLTTHFSKEEMKEIVNKEANKRIKEYVNALGAYTEE